MWRLLRMAGAALVCVPSVGNAQQKSVSITLRGFVPEMSTVQLVEVNPVVSHDIRQPVRDALVARILERSNVHSGYTITLTSENARRARSPALFEPRHGLAVSYRLKYDGVPLRFVDGRAEVERHKRTRGRSGELRMSADGAEGLPTGTYSDTITLSITAR